MYGGDPSDFDDLSGSAGILGQTPRPSLKRLRRPHATTHDDPHIPDTTADFDDSERIGAFVGADAPVYSDEEAKELSERNRANVGAESVRLTLETEHRGADRRQDESWTWPTPMTATAALTL